MVHRKLLIVLICIGIFPFLINGYINSILVETLIYYWLFEFFSWILLPLIVFSTAIKFGGLQLKEVGLHLSLFGKNNLYILALVCIVLAPIDYFIYRSIFSFTLSIFPNEPFFSYQQVMPESSVLRFLIAIYFSVSAGVIEELYFRGFLYKVSQLFSSPITIYLVISPLLFAFIHWEGGLANVIATYIFGMLFSLLYIWQKNLWPLVIGHIYTDYLWFS